MAMDNQSSVFVVGADNKVVRKTISTGYESDTMLEVIDGLTEGDQVVTAGQASLKEQSLVQVIAPKA